MVWVLHCNGEMEEYDPMYLGTSEEPRNAPETVLCEGRYPLPSNSKLMPRDYLKTNHNYPYRDQQERRRYARQRAAIPAYVSMYDSDTPHRTVIFTRIPSLRREGFLQCLP